MTRRKPRAIGIVRVSQEKGRKGEKFHSPEDQRQAMEAFCEQQGWVWLDPLPDELTVSGDAPLEKRPALSQAVTALLTGKADILLGAYNERLWWNHEVRAQVLRLAESVGAQVWAVDQGQLTNGTAADDLNAEVRTSVDRFSRRQNAEKSRKAVISAVERGVVPWTNVTPGYRLGEDGRYEPHPKHARTVAKAFEMRAEGATIAEVRAFLAKRGIKRSYGKVSHLLASRAVLGEIHFGNEKVNAQRIKDGKKPLKPLVNLHAHPPIVDPETWKRAQQVRLPRGPKAESERLLARLGVLRCSGCGGRMVVGTTNNRYAIYRCGHVREDCPRRVTISAELAEQFVVANVREVLADVEGRATAEEGARRAEQKLARAQAEYDKLIELLDPLEPAAARRLATAKEKRDKAQEERDRLGGTGISISVNAARDWDRLTLNEQRALIRATIATATVRPGRGNDRIEIELV